VESVFPCPLPHSLPAMDGEEDEVEDDSEKFQNTSITNEDLRKDDQDWQPLPPQLKARFAAFLPGAIDIFKTWPYLDGEKEPAHEFVKRFLAQPQGYSWSLDFSGSLFCELAYEGFLSTSNEIQVSRDLLLQMLLPWNDPTRNTLDCQDMHISRQVKKRARRYKMSVDAAYDDVMLGCIRMHGEAWLFRGLRWLLRGLFKDGYRGKRSDIHVGVHSFELWDEDGQLVAGDLGYTVGGVYTSMTGFRLQGTKCAGQVQLVLTASLLHKMGYDWWDLGMVMTYKRRLGAHVVKRDEFVSRLHKDRDKLVYCKHDEINGKDLLRHLLDVQAGRSQPAD